jgi:pimeloyl-ACP methyl ester carboxylesterase
VGRVILPSPKTRQTALIPDWFTQHIAAKPDHHELKVMDASIHFQQWSAHDTNRSLLFVHGHAAHAHWWDFIAPAFSEEFRVGALDLSGYGDSDHRVQYRASQFAAEIVAAADALGPETILVAHSFGGSMARIAAYLHPDKFKALVLVDSVISDRRRQTSEPNPIKAPHIRHYDSLAEAKRRFRLRPPQPKPADYIVDYLAEYSVKSTEQGYQFKLDPQVFEKMWPDEAEYPDALTMMKEMTLPNAYIYGDLSRFCPPEMVTVLEEVFPDWRLQKVSAAHHHIFLDQPLAFIEALKTLLEKFQAEG